MPYLIIICDEKKERSLIRRVIFRYHVGTITCMSLVWSSCQLIRVLLKQFTQFYPDCNPTLDLFYNKFFKLVKRKTYIISAVRGKGLYDSMLEYDNVIKQHHIRDEFIETVSIYDLCIFSLKNSRISFKKE